MIVVKLQGGLGNQMFQYAAARGTGDTNIFFDLAFFKTHHSHTDLFTPRSFELNIFSEVIGSKFNSFQERLFNSGNLMAKVLRNLVYGKMHVVKEQDMESVSIPKAERLLLQGFFQSEKYFTAIRDQLIYEFQFPALDQRNQKQADTIKSLENSVSIHVRRSDYLKPKVQEHLFTMSLEYYQQAINLLNRRLVNPTYIIFSDDPTWCESNLLNSNANFLLVKGNDGSGAWKDMCLMAQCKHHIIANSSFSWWGAWLSNREDNLVVAPKNWFIDRSKNDVAQCELIPKNWIKL